LAVENFKIGAGKEKTGHKNQAAGTKTSPASTWQVSELT